MPRKKKHTARGTRLETYFMTSEKIIKPNMDWSGYVHYILTDLEGNRRLVKGHHIVAQAFLGYDPTQYDRKNLESLVVDHQNGLRWDNRLENLRIMTQEDNIHAHYIPHKKVLALSLDENLIEALKKRAQSSGKNRYLSKICEKILKEGLDKNGDSERK